MITYQNSYVITEYTSVGGLSLFSEWLNGLDVSVRARIQARIFRVELGNLGDHRSVGGGVHEFRFMFESGYRVYFSFVGKNELLLLCGGNKATQKKDILKAKNVGMTIS